MRAQSPMTFSSSTTNGGITELQLWAVQVKGYAERRLRRCSRISAGGSLLPVCRFGARSPGCERCTHSGLVTPTLGCVTATRCNRHGASAAEPMIRTCETAPYWHLRDAATGPEMPLRLRRRLIGDGAQRDFQSSSS